MQVRHIIFFIIVSIVVFGLVNGYAETIYTKDGKVIIVKTISKIRNTIWYDVQVGNTKGRVGIAVDKISKILNDNGTISRYSPDYSEEAARPQTIPQEELSKVTEEMGEATAESTVEMEEIKEVKAAAVAGAVEWKTDLTDVPIPDINAQGLIHGGEFVCEEAQLEGGILTLRQGEDFSPDLALKIFLFLKKDEVPENKIYNVAKTDGFGSPHIHLQWKATDSNITETEIFMKDYVMRLEFGPETDGNRRGEIYICLPDEDKSVVAGKFEISADNKSKAEKGEISETSDDTPITPGDIENLGVEVQKTVSGARTVLLIFLIVGIIIGIASFIFWLLMVIDCIKRVFPVPNTKIIWIVSLFIIGPLVAIIYYFVVRRKGGSPS